MGVVQMTPCTLSNRWSEFVEWSARVFDLPVACRFDDKGWAQLSASSAGIKVIDPRLYGPSGAKEQTVVQLEVRMLKRTVERAVGAGAKLVTPPEELPDQGALFATIESPQGIVLWLWDPRSEPDTGRINQGPLHFTVHRQLAAPPARVFEAITKKEHLESFFVHRVDGDIVTDPKVTWFFEGHGAFEVHRMEVVVNEFLSFHWRADRQSYHTRAQFAVTPSNVGTELTVTESGWDADARGLKKAFDNCEGWTTFLGNLAMYLEHDIAILKEPR